MAPTERPPSRLPGGKINPAYTAWRKASKVQSQVSGVVVSVQPPAGEVLSLRVAKLARNDRYVICFHEGRQIPVRVRKGMATRLLKKPIKAQPDEKGVYHHVK